MKSVARRAGVSVATVSRVLNGQTEVVSAETRDRVLAAARELDYRRNSLALALRKGVSHTIGLVVPDISDVYFHSIARGVEDVAQRAGYAVVFCNTDRNVEKELVCLDLLRSQQVDGIIFCGGGLEGERHLVDRDWGSAKVVAIGPHVLDLPSVTVDDSAAMSAVAEHLVSGGRRHILCVAGQPSWLITQRRIAGFEQALTRLGVPGNADLVTYRGFKRADGHAAVSEALKKKVEFDAVITFDDDAALGALLALREHGINVPGEVCVVGCDDNPVSTFVEPSLTSVSFPTYEMGSTAAEMMLALVAGREKPHDVEFSFELHVRRSSSPDLDREGASVDRACHGDERSE